MVRPTDGNDVRTASAAYRVVPRPHRHTFYEVVLVTACDGRHVVDFAEHVLRPPQLYVIAPRQVHSWQVSRLDGYVILFLEDLLGGLPALARTPNGHELTPTPLNCDAVPIRSAHQEPVTSTS